MVNDLVTKHGAGELDRDDTVLLIKLLRHDFSDDPDQYVQMVTDMLATHPDQTAVSAVLANLSFDVVMNLAGTTGDDLLDGDTGRDILRGDLGNDTLKGRDGSDLYVFVRGDGQDTIHDDGFGDTDELVIYGYTPAEVSLRPLSSGSDSFIMEFAGTTDTITVTGGYSIEHWNRLEAITFEDGTVWDADEIQNRVTDGQSSDSDDLIVGSSASERLEGGLGNDTLQGEESSDTYVFARGDGQDIINDNGFYDNDRLELSGFLPSEVTIRPISGGSDTLLLTFAGATDSIEIQGGLSTPWDAIEEIAFDDGTLWDFGTIRNKATAGQASDGNDLITGGNGTDILNGGLGNDTLTGLDGSDTYLFYRGGGRDVIHDDGWADNDRIEIFGYTPDQVTMAPRSLHHPYVDISFEGTNDHIEIRHIDQLEQIHFENGQTFSGAAMAQLIVDSQSSDGNDLILGDRSNNTLTGGLGNDTLDGGDGDDTYVYALGDGYDQIKSTGQSNAFDQLTLQNITQSSLYFHSESLDWGHIGLRFNTGAGQVYLVEGLAGAAVQEIDFDDGSNLTLAELRQLYAPGGAAFGTRSGDYIENVAGVGYGFGGNDELKGGSGSDTLYGGGHNDILYGQWYGTRTETAANVLYGGHGNDKLYGAGGKDTLDGGDGNDSLYGEGGDDWLIFSAGDDDYYGQAGSDTIDASSTSGWFKVVMHQKYITTDNSRFQKLDSVENVIGNDANNKIDGDNHSNNRIEGRGGNDLIGGGRGQDTLLGGEGNDLLRAEWSGTRTDTSSDLLDGGAGNDTLYGDNGQDTLLGGNGHDLIEAEGGNDLIDGGSGNDTIKGGGGTDQYLFGANSGVDVVQDFANGIEKIDLTATSLTFLDLTITSDGGDALVDLTAGNSIRLTGLSGQIDENDFVFA